MPKNNQSKEEETYTQEQFENDLEELEALIEQSQETNQSGGKKTHTGELRHFKLVTVDGKEVDLDATANIKEHQTPLSAAKKLLRSYCRAHKLKEANRLKVDIEFTIRETNRGSKNKIYGPYSGKYRKYTPAEMKKAQASGITFHMKPEVKIIKAKKMKGGAKM
jgi:hypothetical protein